MGNETFYWDGLQYKNYVIASRRICVLFICIAIGFNVQQNDKDTFPDICFTYTNTVNKLFI